ncbi:MAG: phosphomethylpyrimidine synthase ThiC [Desulfobacterales bacterium]|nr:phosphomethylpyrimidine synthase ThiC [Desulfobacterales bacterium]
MFLMDLLIRRCSRGVPRGTGSGGTGGGNGSGTHCPADCGGQDCCPANPNRKHQLCAIGEGCTVKINVNIGTSGTRCDPALEEEEGKGSTCKRCRCPDGPLDRRRPCRDPEEDPRVRYHGRDRAGL